MEASPYHCSWLAARVADWSSVRQQIPGSVHLVNLLQQLLQRFRCKAQLQEVGALRGAPAEQPRERVRTEGGEPPLAPPRRRRPRLQSRRPGPPHCECRL